MALFNIGLTCKNISYLNPTPKLLTFRSPVTGFIFQIKVVLETGPVGGDAEFELVDRDGTVLATAIDVLDGDNFVEFTPPSPLAVTDGDYLQLNLVSTPSSIGNDLSAWIKIAEDDSNMGDTSLLDRNNHTGTQLANTVSDFSEAVDDRIGNLFTAGSLINLNYNDPSNTFSIAVDTTALAEIIRDTIAAALTAGTNVTINVNDPSDTITINAGAGISINSLAVYRGTVYKAFGDSLTNGFGTTTPAVNCFPQLIVDDTGWTLTNNGTNSDQAADQADDVFATTVADDENYSVLLGTNDNYQYYDNNELQEVFQLAHLSLLAWLALTPSHRYLGSDTTNITYSAGWSSRAIYGSIARQCTTNGATATFTLYGNAVYVCALIEDSNGGEFSLSVDGDFHGTFNCYRGSSVNTRNSRTYSPFLIRIPNLSDGAHTVVLTVTSSTNASNIVTLIWVAGVEKSLNASGKSSVYVGTIPRFTDARYLSDGHDGLSYLIYNELIEENVNTLVSDLLNVVLIKSDKFLNNTTDLQADGVHPTDNGHQKLAYAFLEAMNALIRPIEKQLSSKSLKNLRWEPLTNGDETSPELVFANGDVVMVGIPY